MRLTSYEYTFQLEPISTVAGLPIHMFHMLSFNDELVLDYACSFPEGEIYRAPSSYSSSKRDILQSFVRNCFVNFVLITPWRAVTSDVGKHDLDWWLLLDVMWITTVTHNHEIGIACDIWMNLHKI